MRVRFSFPKGTVRHAPSPRYRFRSERKVNCLRAAFGRFGRRQFARRQFARPEAFSGPLFPVPPAASKVSFVPLATMITPHARIHTSSEGNRVRMVQGEIETSLEPFKLNISGLWRSRYRRRWSLDLRAETWALGWSACAVCIISTHPLTVPLPFATPRHAYVFFDDRRLWSLYLALFFLAG